MNILVIGVGKIGTAILESLANEGHDVTVLDENPDVISDVTNLYDVIGVCGGAADCEALEEASVADAELVIATTSSDELNMLSCFIAKKMGARHTIARIRNPKYNDRNLGFMRQQLDLSYSINPELLTARELFNLLKLPSATKVDTFSVKDFEMIELKLKPDSALIGVSLSDMRSRFKAQFLICAVERNGEAYIPDGNFKLESGDTICLTAARTEVTKLLKELGLLQKQAKNVMILGGSRTAFYLAKMLTSSGSNVTVIEKNRKYCDELCRELPKATIINADGAQREVLIEEGLYSLDAFVSLTGIDEENILISSFAHSRKVPKIISKVNREELIPMAEQLGLECVVSPKTIIASKVLRYARALENSVGSSVETLYKIMDGKVEVLEFKVKTTFTSQNIALKDLKTKPNILIAAIFRDRKIIIPSGDDVLIAGDKVIVIAANQRINTLSDILK